MFNDRLNMKLGLPNQYVSNLYNSLKMACIEDLKYKLKGVN